MRRPPCPTPVISAAQADLREVLVRHATDGVARHDLKSALHLELHRLQLEEDWYGEDEEG